MDTARTQHEHGSIVLINDFNSQQRKKEDGEKRWEAVDLVPGFSRRRREKEEEGKMRIGMGVKVKEGVGCLGSGEWAEGGGGGGGGVVCGVGNKLRRCQTGLIIFLMYIFNYKDKLFD